MAAGATTTLKTLNPPEILQFFYERSLKKESVSDLAPLTQCPKSDPPPQRPARLRPHKAGSVAHRSACPDMSC